MNSSKRVTLGIILLVAIGLSYLIGFASGASSIPPEMLVAGVGNKDQGQPAEVDFGAFWDVWNILNEKYVGTSTDDQARVWGAIKGMTESLGDPYTVFFPPVEAEIFQTEISGNFEGVGMEVGVRDGRLLVVTPIKGTPADRAGVKAGDFILKIDDRDAATLSTDEAVKLIRGKAGTVVKLTLSRPGVDAPVVLSITRAKIDIPTIETSIKGENVFVISLYSFNANSASLFRQALRDFVNSGSHKLVLDLRGNPGGYLESAVDMASWFLPSGKVIVKEEFRGGEEGDDYRSKGYDIFDDSLEMVVLVDEGSASASEILAGALKEHGVAELVGTTTFGKGSVQELVPITGGTSLKVTIAKWLTPNGHSISEQGIEPDYVVEMPDNPKPGEDPQMAKALELLSARP